MTSPLSSVRLAMCLAIVCAVHFTSIHEAKAQQLASSQVSRSWLSAHSWSVHTFIYGGALGFAPGAKHGGAVVGSGLTYVEKGSHALTQSLELGYVHQAHFARGGTLDTSLAYRYCLRGIGLCGQVGPLLGAELLQYPGVVYKAGPSGEFEAHRPESEPNMRVGVALTVEQELCTSKHIPLSLFVSYREIALTSFLPAQGLPLFARTQLGAGVAVRPGGCPS